MNKRTSSDHRTRVTRMLIRQAFTQLLAQKPIQSISIKELCELAGINRGTFYAHYTDVYDLLQQMEAEMLADFERALAPLLKAQDHPYSPVEITAGIFQCLKENSDLCTVTLGDYGDKAFALRLINLGRERCLEAYAHYFSSASEQQLEYFYAFASSGCIGILQKWLADGLRLPAREVAQTANNFMLHGLGLFERRSEATGIREFRN